MRAHNEELADANTQLRHVNNDLDNFIYAASHDLKAPISNIEGLVSVLKKNLPAESLSQERVGKPLSLMEVSIARFKKTIADLSSISQLQRESKEAHSQLYLQEIVEEVRLDLEHQLEEVGGHLDLQIGTCPAILFSRKNLRSIVYNLLSNAIKCNRPLYTIAS